jgi:hypothetical protein
MEYFSGIDLRKSNFLNTLGETGGRGEGYPKYPLEHAKLTGLCSVTCTEGIATQL